MNLANRLTLSRIGLTFLLMWFLFMQGITAKVIAIIIFLIACLTDFLDGWVARKKGQVSDFGKVMDPVADKVLVLGVFLSFVELRLIPAWMVIIIMTREFLITAVRLFAIKKGMVLAAESAGKHKAVSQMVTIFFILLFIIIRESMLASTSRYQEFENSFKAGILFLMCFTLGLTLYSGFIFVWQNRKLIRSL